MVRSRRVESSGSATGTCTSGASGEDSTVEAHVTRLALVVELFAQPLAELLQNLARVDLRAEAALHGQDRGELAEVRLDRRFHVRVLQLAGDRRRRRA